LIAATAGDIGIGLRLLRDLDPAARLRPMRTEQKTGNVVLTVVGSGQTDLATEVPNA
jgi:hypothetical protein